MTASDMQDTTCLDIAVDHRIKALFERFESRLRGPSTHVQRIEDMGKSMNRSQEEIRVTSELAGPAAKGGIAIVLQQPRSIHSFGKGTNFVINECVTLRTLGDIFRTVSCGTLDIRTDICVVDLLPYEPRHTSLIGDEELMNLFKQSTDIIREKDPDVLLCAGKIRLSRERDQDKIKGIARHFETVGVGRTFNEVFGIPLNVPRRVNGFHPSYAMNYHPHISLFRQLLILACAETCALLRGDWEDEGWMEALRSECERFSSDLSNEPLKRYISDYRWPYRDILIGIQSASIHLLRNLLLADGPTEVSYNDLLSSKLSILCNDASLIIGKMHTLCEQGWPEKFDVENQSVLNESAVVTYNVIQRLLSSVGVMHTSRFSDILQHGIDSITACLEIDQCSRKARKFILKQASRAFLKMAVSIEALLSDLMLEGEVLTQSSEPEDVLPAMIGNLFVTD